MTRIQLAKAITSEGYYLVTWWDDGTITSKGFKPLLGSEDNPRFHSFDISVPQDLEIPNQYTRMGWDDFIILSERVPKIVKHSDEVVKNCSSYLHSDNMIVRFRMGSMMGGIVTSIFQQSKSSYIVSYLARRNNWFNPLTEQQSIMDESDRLFVEVYSYSMSPTLPLKE